MRNSGIMWLTRYQIHGLLYGTCEADQSWLQGSPLAKCLEFLSLNFFLLLYSAACMFHLFTFHARIGQRTHLKRFHFETEAPFSSVCCGSINEGVISPEFDRYIFSVRFGVL